MSKFWTLSGLLLIVGLLLLVTHGHGDIRFSELETECRFDRGQSSDIILKESGSLGFEGTFFVDNPDAELDYSYNQQGDRITLNVRSSRVSEPDSFQDDCLGIVVYSAETSNLREGSYMVELRHNSRTVEKQVIQIE